MRCRSHPVALLTLALAATSCHSHKIVPLGSVDVVPWPTEEMRFDRAACAEAGAGATVQGQFRASGPNANLPATVRGRITGMSGRAVANAIVRVDSTRIWTMTSGAGEYRLSILAETAGARPTLVIKALLLGLHEESIELATLPGDSILLDFRLCDRLDKPRAGVRSLPGTNSS